MTPLKQNDIVYHKPGRSNTVRLQWRIVAFHKFNDAVTCVHNGDELICKRDELRLVSEVDAENAALDDAEAAVVKQKQDEFLAVWNLGLRSAKELGDALGITPQTAGIRLKQLVGLGLITDDRPKKQGKKHE